MANSAIETGRRKRWRASAAAHRERCRHAKANMESLKVRHATGDDEPFLSLMLEDDAEN